MIVKSIVGNFVADEVSRARQFYSEVLGLPGNRTLGRAPLLCSRSIWTTGEHFGARFSLSRIITTDLALRFHH